MGEHLSASADAVKHKHTPPAHIHTNIHLNSKKRKRGSDSRCQTLDQAFLVYPYPISTNTTPQTLVPIRLIVRSDLPLSCLEPTLSLFDSSGRFFAAHIPVLDSHDEKGNNGLQASVLIAKLEKDDTLFAIERVHDGIFALCRLRNSAKDYDITQSPTSKPTLTRRSPLPQQESIYTNKASWWRTAAIEDHTTNRWKVAQANHATQRNSLVNPSPMIVNPKGNLDQSPRISPTLDGQASMETNDVRKSAIGLAPEPSLRSLTPNEVYSNIIDKYLDTLHLSKISLAYFAKGPLSRARIAFSEKDNESMQMCGLSVFLRQCLLIKSMDKKYRCKLPEAMHTVMLGITSANLEAHTMSKPRKPKKLKPSADGIFPSEEEFIRRSWLASAPTDVGFSSPEDRETIVKEWIAELRVRETQMQLILTLEVLALEASANPSGPGAAKTQKESQASRFDEKVDKKKRDDGRAKDLSVYLDLLVDRLCIWQSLQQEEHLDTPVNNKTPIHNASSLSGKRTTDAMRAFCLEVVIPFYMSRLPNQATSVNRKLGGPSAPSPVKRSSRCQTTRKPGEPTMRPKPAKLNRKPLHRVTSTIVNSTAKRVRQAPSLNRSATDSALLSHPIKREPSEIPPLSSIAPSEPSAIPVMIARPLTPAAVARPGLASTNIQRLSQRQVDFDAMTAANQAKLRRKAEIDRKLRDAIHAVQKPRREAVGREVVEEAERRKDGAGTIGSKKAAVERGLGGGVQVTATPRRARRRRADVVLATPRRGKTAAGEAQLQVWREDGEDDGDTEGLEMPSSSFIPSTAIKSRDEMFVPGTNHRIPDSARELMDRRMNDAVAQTPSRGPAKQLALFTSSTVAMNSRWTGETKELAEAAPPETPQKLITRKPAMEKVHLTPISVKNMGLKLLATEKSQRVGPGPEASIYDALGWNDDFGD